MNISGPAAVAKPEMLFYAPGDLTVTFSLSKKAKHTFAPLEKGLFRLNSLSRY